MINHWPIKERTRSGVMNYYSRTDGYYPSERTIYADWMLKDCPNPCRKYHISSATFCAHIVAEIVLPILREAERCHKIVQNHRFLVEQTYGIHADQAGKFITVYMNPGVEFRNALLQEINVELQNSAQGVQPGPKRPMLRLGRGGSENTQVFETPVFSGPKGPFIFGGFEVNPLR